MSTSDNERLIAAIVSWIAAHGSFTTKTKLLKLLYLFDHEYYRLHRETFSGFTWKFYHLGPWAAEYDPMLEGLLAEQILTSQRTNSEHDTHLLKPIVTTELGEPFQSTKDEQILRIVLNTWGKRSTGEILDYVYFQTAPMETGVRNQPLDFSAIQPEKPAPYVRSSSGKSPSEIQTLRKQFETRRTEGSKPRPPAFPFTPPQYDQEYLDAMSKLETV